jgi:pimeloyl-ACP methyl ester carboxylesterase
MEELVRVGDVDICYETFGSPADPAMLLIMGLGTQMVAWHEDFCNELAGHGFFVIRHDNRDIGRSSRMEPADPPSLWQMAIRSRDSAYTLADMAADSIGVLDHLGIEKAHVIGASMGGMIAQTIAIRFPSRVLSLVSIMSNTGSFWSGQPALGLYAVLLKPSPSERSAFIDHAVEMFSKIGGNGFEPDVEDLRDIATRSYDRGHDPRGSSRQLGAIIADRDRSAALAKLQIPATVIHGLDDRLVRPSGGRATARAIPGARLVEIPGMGHGLPRGAWPTIIDAIVANAQRAATREAQPAG